MSTPISLAMTNFMFCHRYGDVSFEYFHLWFCFPDSLLFLMGLRHKKFPANDPGVQSGQETQFLFSEADVRDSETDYASQRAPGKHFPFYPHFPLSLCEIYFRQLGFSCSSIFTA